MVLGTIDGLNDDPRRAGSLIRRLQETGVTVHLVARLTPSDAAEYFGIPTDQVRKWLREGEVEGYKDGGRWLVNQRSLLDFIIESPESDAGAVVYVIRPQNEGADETVEQEWDYLRSYCDAKSLTVLRVIVERAEHCWETVHGTDGVGEGWRETSFEMRPGGQSAMEGLQNGGEHLVLGHANGLSRDPRRATLLIREIEQTGVLVHLVAALTPNEAAGYFDVSGDQVRRWLRNASIDGDKDGGRWFVNQRSLVDYIAFRDQWAEERARDERTQGWVDAAGIALTVLWKTVSWWGHRKRHDTG